MKMSISKMLLNCFVICRRCPSRAGPGYTENAKLFMEAAAFYIR